MPLRYRDFYLLIFVLFSLYLMGDAFSRWDGFSYYASFSEFLPSVALASILWSIVSVCTAFLLWMFYKVLSWICKPMGIKIRTDHLLVYTCIFILSGIFAWKGKKLIWPDVQTAFQIKLVVLLCISVISILITWLFRDKTEQWAGTVMQSITPLVWLFGIFVLLAVPLVAYYAWIDSPDIKNSQNIARNDSAETSRPNIILVSFDALAARNMSVYGYSRETTPFISKWSKNATVFARAEAASNFTTPAAASLMTGKRVWTHHTYHIAGMKPYRSNVESLPYMLKENGYFNMAFVVNPFASINVLGMTNSFDIAPLTSEFGESSSLFGWKFGIVDKILYRAFGDSIRLHNWIIRNDFILSKVINLISRNISQTSVPPEKVFNRFLEIINDDFPKPFFSWIHIFPPHDPYLPTEPFMENTTTELRTYKNQEKLIEESYKYLFQYQSFPEEIRPAIELMRDYYDEYITYIDKQFENFIEELNKRGIENTVIILSADHGESFDHGYFTHGGPFLYEQVTHIPLIIKESGQKKGQIIDPLVEQIDIPATILELADIPVPSWMEGRSLVSTMRGETLAQRPAFSMNFEGNRSRGHQINTGSIAVWEGDYKLIYYLKKDEALLFNLKQDPDELNDLIKTEQEKYNHMLLLIKESLDQANGKMKN